MPLNVYPPQGVRPLVAHLEIMNDKEIAMTFFGDTYRHRSAFMAAGLHTEKEEKSCAEDVRPGQVPQKLEHFCILPPCDISIEENGQRVHKLLIADIGHCIVDVRIFGECDPQTDVGCFLADMKDDCNLIFRGA